MQITSQHSLKYVLNILCVYFCIPPLLDWDTRCNSPTQLYLETCCFNLNMLRYTEMFLPSATIFYKCSFSYRYSSGELLWTVISICSVKLIAVTVLFGFSFCLFVVVSGFIRFPGQAALKHTHTQSSTHAHSCSWNKSTACKWFWSCHHLLVL